MTPEGRVKAEVRRIFREHGGLCDLNVMTGYGLNSRADFTACYMGRFIAIETKADSRSRITPLQLQYLVSVLDAGGVALIIHTDNIGDLVQVLQEIQQCSTVHPTQPEMPVAGQAAQRIRAMAISALPQRSPARRRQRRGVATC